MIGTNLCRYLALFALSSIWVAIPSSAQDVQMRDGGNGRTEICLNVSNQRKCVMLVLHDSNALDFLKVRLLTESRGAAVQVSERVLDVGNKIDSVGSRVDAMGTKIEELTKSIGVANNQHLAAIRDQLILTMETLPLAMIDDQSVVREIRALVKEEVRIAFEERQ